MMRTLALLLVLLEASAQAAESFVLDRVHTQIQFNVSHLGFSMSEGEFLDFSGRIEWDQANMANSRVSLRIRSESVDMDDQAWNRAMLGRSYFDAKRYPWIEFSSTRVDMQDERNGRLFGQLTLLGQSREVVLDFTFNQRAKHRLLLRDTLGFSASGSLKRSDFGMHGGLPHVGDEVKLRFEVEAYKDVKGALVPGRR
jgi:polyisoprenoid-binding protein YceI